MIAILKLFRQCGIKDQIIIKNNVSCNTDGEYHKKNFGEHFRDCIAGELPSFWKYLWDGGHLIQTVEFDSRCFSLFFCVLLKYVVNHVVSLKWVKPINYSKIIN